MNVGWANIRRPRPARLPQIPVEGHESLVVCFFSRKTSRRFSKERVDVVVVLDDLCDELRELSA